MFKKLLQLALKEATKKKKHHHHGIDLDLDELFESDDDGGDCGGDE